ncbi:MAG: hypothetical protein HOC74_18610 [Gemmatimonadetes bacterium]|jgi:hypothetical protein|nr:hypothetical protein [Gemmatimonadota bacterium]
MPMLFPSLPGLYPAEAPIQLLAYDLHLNSVQVEVQTGWKKSRLQRRRFWQDGTPSRVMGMVYRNLLPFQGLEMS